MSYKISYSKYEELYPKRVIIKKEGVFYTVRNESARVIHAHFDFKGWRTVNGIPTIGIQLSKLEDVKEKLNQFCVSYIVADYEGIIVEKDFGDRNTFEKYEMTSVEDMPLQKSRKTNDDGNVNVKDDRTKKLMEISVKYLERMLEGFHPVNNTPIPDESVLNDENVRRCFSFIIDMFNGADNQPQKTKVKRNNKEKQLKDYHFKNNYRTIINEMIIQNDIKMGELQAIANLNISKLMTKEANVTSYKISNWLKDNGYLVQVEDNGNSHREASELGTSVGIINVTINNGDAGFYVSYRFTPQGQKFVYENLESILSYKKQK